MCRWWYIVCTTFMKLSVAAMLYRFATKPFYRYLLWILCTTMVVWHTFVFFIYIFQCSPVSHNWDKLVFKPGTCLPNKVMENISYAFSANDIFLNFTFALVPIPLLWNVQMTRKAKYSIYATMSLGCL